MGKKCYRFFGGLLTAQENWLNKYAEEGWRLTRTGKLLYEFEECQPGQVCYHVEFIGEKSKQSATEYHDFLEEMGCRVFYKNIDLNSSAGKVRWDPWAEKGGRIATNATTLNRELLIVEMENGGRPFELHTSYEDKALYYSRLRAPWLFNFVVFGIWAVVSRSVISGLFALVFLLPTVLYQGQIVRLRREGKTREW